MTVWVVYIKDLDGLLKMESIWESFFDAQQEVKRLEATDDLYSVSWHIIKDQVRSKSQCA